MSSSPRTHQVSTSPAHSGKVTAPASTPPAVASDSVAVLASSRMRPAATLRAITGEVLLTAADSVTYLRAMTGEAAGWQPTTTTPGLVAFTAAASPDTSPPPPTATNRNCMSGT